MDVISTLPKATWSLPHSRSFFGESASAPSYHRPSAHLLVQQKQLAPRVCEHGRQAPRGPEMALASPTAKSQDRGERRSCRLARKNDADSPLSSFGSRDVCSVASFPPLLALAANSPCHHLFTCCAPLHPSWGVDNLPRLHRASLPFCGARLRRSAWDGSTGSGGAEMK